MKYLFLILLSGLPWGAFVFKQPDIWHGHGMFFQLGLLLLFACSFFEKQKRVGDKNIPLGVFFLWSGLITSFYWYITLTTHGKYATTIFFPFFNFLCFLIFYKFSVGYLTKKDIQHILFGIKISVFLVVCYCGLQLLDLDQFYARIKSATGTIGDDQLVGTLGNTHHLAAYLAICSPLFFEKGWFNRVGLFALWGIIIASASATGFSVAVAVLLFYAIHRKKRVLIGIIIIACLVFLWFYQHQLSTFFSASHRFDIWKMFFEKFRERPISGFGMGILNAWQLDLGSVGGPATKWRHAHFEYFQVMIELGVIGVSILLWNIFDYFRRFRKFNTPLTIQLKSIFFGFILVCFTSYPCHLWLPASMGMLSYAFLYTLEVSDNGTKKSFGASQRCCNVLS